jgi:hypothetical protein
MAQSRVRLITQLARKYGLDPHAVLAIASVEGQSALHGGTSIGDQGTSYGPFQLHRGGALPSGKGSKWAHSPAGIEYAIRQMSGTSARGKRGKAAVSAISAEFERPADVPGEIAKAMGYYGNVKGGGPGIAAGLNSGPRNSSLGPETGIGGSSGLSQDAFRSMVASTLLQNSKARAMGMEPPAGGLLALAVARKQLMSAQDTFGPVGGHADREGPPVRGGAGGKIQELFYDPEGGIKFGKQIGAIGGHDDHVHVSLSNRRAQLAAIKQAQRMGLRVSEDGVYDPHVEHVHAEHSYHYKTYGKGRVRQAADVSGDPRKMDAYYRWVARRYNR